VVCEELPIPYGSKNRRKQRYIAGVTSPASPLYVHDMSLSRDVDVSALSAHEQAPMIAVAVSARGFVLYLISVDTRSIKTTEGLTHDAVIARVGAGGFSPPLYLHQDIPPDVAAAVLKLAPLAHRATVYLPGSLQTPSAEKPGSFLRSVLNAIRLDACLPPEEGFTVSALPATEARARPLYLSTAAQVGLIPTPGIPSLVDAIVPKGAEALVKRFLLRLLLHPPPHRVSCALDGALQSLEQMPATLALPAYPILSAASVSRFIMAKEANAILLADLHAVLVAVRGTLLAGSLVEFARHALVVTKFETGLGCRA
jgi:hypothetical protein